MKLTKLQKATRFIIYRLGDLLLLSMITGILPIYLSGMLYQILGI